MEPESQLPFRRPAQPAIRRGSQEDGERRARCPRPPPHLSAKKRSTTSSSFKEKGWGWGWGSWRQSRCRTSEGSASSKSRRRLDRAIAQSSGGIIFRGCKQGILPGRKVFPSQALPAPVIGEAWQPEEGLVAPDECLPCTRGGRSGFSRAAE